MPRKRTILSNVRGPLRRRKDKFILGKGGGYAKKSTYKRGKR